jgi:protein-tyrosine phosphatase
MDWWIKAPANEARPTRGPGRPRAAEITSNLLIGEFPRPEDAQWLRDHHRITAVLNLQDGVDFRLNGLDSSELAAAYGSADIEFVHAPISDGSTDAMSIGLDDALDALNILISSGHRVFLHCNAGLNRAPTLANAFLHAYGGMSLADALRLVKARHTCGPYMTVLEERFGPRDSKPDR